MAKYIISEEDLDQFGQFSGSIDNDTITVENFQDTISYTILGLSGQDSIIGATGKDILFGMEENDTILGRDNNDILYGNEGNDSLEGGSGYDTIYGGQGNDIIKDIGDYFNSDGINILFGNLGDDSITVSRSENADLFGGQGKDILTGNEGSNRISGDRGQDILRGDFDYQGGADTFIISKTADLNEIPTGTENADLILDFINSEDKIGLVGVTFEQLLISDIQPQQIDSIFGEGRSFDQNFESNITKFLKIESGGELLAVLGRDRDNFTLTANDFVII